MHLSSVLKVKEGTWLGTYSKRFCVLCCTKLYIYKISAGGSPNSKPSYSITLSEVSVINHTSNKHHYCVRLRSVMDKEPEIVLAFTSLLQQSQWVKRIKKVSKARPRGPTQFQVIYRLSRFWNQESKFGILELAKPKFQTTCQRKLL